MALQNIFTQSIKPSTLSQLRDSHSFVSFITYFEKDCKVFIESTTDLEDISCRFGDLSKHLTEKKLLDTFLQRTAMNSRFCSLRLTPLDKHLTGLWSSFTTGEQQIRQECEIQTGKNLDFPLSKEAFEQLSETEKVQVREAMEKSLSNYVNLIVGLSGLINQIFFVFESQCKMICSLACYHFAISYARDSIIQHAEIWSALKKLSKSAKDPGTECEICLMQQDCKFSVDFMALANIYCYAIKVRMLADYDSYFYDNVVWQKLKVYFDNLRLVIQSQKTITKKCVGVGA